MKNLLILLLCVVPIFSKPRGSRIIGGTEAFAGQFPFAAAIYKSTPGGNYFCTGSLLNDLWLLTAGQCVDGSQLFTILLGTHRLNGDVETVQRLATDTYVLHPDYNAVTIENDIGLIRLRLPIMLSTYIQTVRLSPANLFVAGGLTFGWGQVTDEDPGLSDTLNYAKLVWVSDYSCKEVYGNQIGENMACFAGYYNEGTCFGDSGSPLLQDYIPGMTVVTAIASFFSVNGCESTDPSGYTNVFPYNRWINNITEV